MDRIILLLALLTLPTILSDRSCYYSSPEQTGYTLYSWFYNEANEFAICEDLCKQNSQCDAWMRRETWMACYLSFDKDLRLMNPSLEPYQDHHPYLLLEGSCNPTTQPTTSPTVSTPSPTTNTAAPTAVTPSPTMCMPHNEGYSQYSNDGVESTLNTIIDDISFKISVPNPAQIYSVQTIAGDATDTIPAFENDDKQQLMCLNVVSCLQSTFAFKNNTVCNIHCNELLSCGLANFNIDSCDNIHIICSGDKSCQNTNITITNAAQSNIIIDCAYANTCTNMHIDIYGNTTSTDVTCYEHNACDYITVIVEKPENSFLHLYEHSIDVVFDNGVGLLSVDRQTQYVQCNTQYHYIEWNDTLSDPAIKSLILNEYPSSTFPCANVTVKCHKNDNETTSTGACEMDFVVDSFFSVTPTPTPIDCYWIAVDDIIGHTCDGTCFSSPSVSPTPAPTDGPTDPTNHPSSTPSNAPSFSPSFAPSDSTGAPSAPPSVAPSNNPSIAPSSAPTQPPTDNPTPTPTDAPTATPTRAPTGTPTQAPTRNPTSPRYDFDSQIALAYVLQHLNDANVNYILNNTLNHAIEYMQEIIESHYYSTKYLDQYESFTVIISGINGVDFKNEAEFTKSNIEAYTEAEADELHLQSKIEFNEEKSVYILGTSQDTEWYPLVTDTFRTYFENDNVEFYVSDPDALTIVTDEPPSSFGKIFWSLNAMLFVCCLIGLAAFIYNWKSPHISSLTGIDEADWLSVILYGIQIYDMVSDWNLTYEIFQAIGVEAAHTPEDREGVMDTPKEWILFWSGWCSLAATILPYGLNIWAAIKIPKLTEKIVCARNYFQEYRLVFIGLVIMSGGSYPALTLVTSNIFGLIILNTGLSRFEINSLVKIRVVTTVLTENIPQLAVQLMYSYAISDISQNTFLAFCTSMASIVASVMIWCMNKDSSKEQRVMEYYLEVKKMITSAENTEMGDDEVIPLSAEEKAEVENKKGVTHALAKKMVAIHGDIDIANYQIAYVHVRSDNFVLRIVQQMHFEDLNVSDDVKVDFENEKEMKKYFTDTCLCDFARHKKELSHVILAHFGMNKEDFQIIYHSKYPSQASVINTTANTTLNATEGMIELAEISEYKLLTDYRTEIMKGIEIVSNETQHLNKTKPVTNSQINGFIETLSDNKMKPQMIEDILKLAVRAGAFKQRERRESDIDLSISRRATTDIVFEENYETIEDVSVHTQSDKHDRESTIDGSETGLL